MSKNKKELVIITNSCYPINSAVGSLSLKCADYLEKEYNIRIITVQDRNYAMNGQKIGNYKFYTVTQNNYKKYSIFKEKINNSRGINKFYNFIMFQITKTVMYIERKIFFMDNRWWYEKKVNKILNKLWSELKFDAILSVSSPIGSHISAMKFKEKHPEVFWVSYWVDLFSGKNFKQNILIPHSKYVELENKIISKSDFVMTTSEIFVEFEKRTDETKIQKINYTLKNDILGNNKNNQVFENEKPLIICMGSFQNKIRNPEYMLKIFSKLNIEYNLELYTNGCEKIISKYANKNNKNIKYIGLVEYEKLKQRLNDSDFVINIGNSLSSSVPSKVLELISYCKPMIDFYYKNNKLEILNKYPIVNRIQIDDQIENVVTELENFIIKNKSNKISTEEIKKIFVDYSEDTIKDKINNIFKRK